MHHAAASSSSTLSKCTRWILLGVLCALGVALASPLLHPKSANLVCTSLGGLKLLASDASDADDSTPAPSGGNMDCPLCAALSNPQPSSPDKQPPTALVHAPRLTSAAHGTHTTAPPLPSRGPPLHLI